MARPGCPAERGDTTTAVLVAGVEVGLCFGGGGGPDGAPRRRGGTRRPPFWLRGWNDGRRGFGGSGARARPPSATGELRGTAARPWSPSGGGDGEDGRAGDDP